MLGTAAPGPIVPARSRGVRSSQRLPREPVLGPAPELAPQNQHFPRASGICARGSLRALLGGPVGSPHPHITHTFLSHSSLCWTQVHSRVWGGAKLAEHSFSHEAASPATPSQESIHQGGAWGLGTAGAGGGGVSAEGAPLLYLCEDNLGLMGQLGSHPQASGRPRQEGHSLPGAPAGCPMEWC